MPLNDTRRPAWKKPEREFNSNLRPLEVDVRNGDIEEALKVLRNKVSKDGVLTELRNRKYAEKPSEKKRRKHREALKKLRRSRGKKARVKEQTKRF